jgi:quinoprotein glucose dehydrogenase
MHKIVAAAAVGLGLALAPITGAPLWAQAAQGLYTGEQAQRGSAVYKTSCAMCHGEGLEGNDSAPALTGQRFLGAWQGQTASDLVTRIRTTMPLNAPGSLGMAASTDAAAYILSVNNFPKGPAELPKDSAGLKQILIK